jgi:hypothetical protein
MIPNIQNKKTYADLLADTEMSWDYPDDEESYIDTKYVDEEKVEYKIIFGNEKIVFIKAGADESTRGYENKYLKMARRVHERLGATVICASNPDAPHEHLDEQEIRWVIAEKDLSNVEISFIGASDGAYHNLSLVRRFPEIVKWIGINASYIDVTELEERLTALPNIFKVMIYGTKDDDFTEATRMLKNIVNDNLILKIVAGADHSFTGMVEEFVETSDYV